jgi:CheY-like chemotaxis protein
VGLPGTARGSAPKRRILIVDDNVDAANMLALYLEACGHEIMVLHQAEHALAVAGAERFDVFLLDIGLPGLDGNQLARRLRNMELARDALLIAITGYGQQADQDRSFAAGFDLFFVKPVDPEGIAASLSAGTSCASPPA